MRVVEAAGARHESAGAGPEDEPDTGAEKGVSDDEEWEGSDMGDWVAGTGVN